MFLYLFSDSLTGEIQQPFLAHNDDEAVRIAHMAFANVPQPILHDLFLGKVTGYDHSADPRFTFTVLYRGLEYMTESEDNNDR